MPPRVEPKIDSSAGRDSVHRALEIVAKTRVDGQRLDTRKERKNLELLGGAVIESVICLSKMLEELVVIADRVGRSALCRNQL